MTITDTRPIAARWAASAISKIELKLLQSAHPGPLTGPASCPNRPDRCALKQSLDFSLSTSHSLG